MPDDPTIQTESLITDPPPVVETASVTVPLPAPKTARKSAAAKSKPAPKKAATKPQTATKAVPADPAQTIALHCLHPSQYVEHMPFPGKNVTVEWVRARLVYRERLEEILASGAYESTAACPTLPHDPLCGH